MAAAAIPLFSMKYFDNALALAKFVNQDDSVVASVVSVVSDTNGKFVLFYIATA